MLDRLLFVLFNIHPKPLPYSRTIDILGDRYAVHSQHPVEIIEKESGYIQIKSFGRMYLYCGKMLHLSVRKNTTLITIGWAKDKSQIFEVRKNLQKTAQQTQSDSSHSIYIPTGYADTSHHDSPRSSSAFCSSDNSNADCSSSDSGGGDGGGGD
ncbi:TPA: hypothetical protein ACKRTE_001444 [Providencia rettgeri]